MQSVERVEVLLDGAAAQYGSDAIAGVVNLILKSDRRGASGEIYAGQYFKGDGETYGAAGNIGIPLGKDGFLNFTAEHRFHDYSNAGGPDQRVVLAVESGERPEYAQLDDYPFVNRVFGDARNRLFLMSANAALRLTEAVELYGFGSIGRKKAGGWANFRLPTRLPEIYPDGFTPVDRLLSHDYSGTAGLRGTMGGWGWDVSTTYGLNRNRVTVTNSANVDLFRPNCGSRTARRGCRSPAPMCGSGRGREGRASLHRARRHRCSSRRSCR
jgi:iron complex outermembrane receptor protein